MTDLADELRKRLLGAAGTKTTSGISRLWKTSRSAVGLATSALGSRFRGDGKADLASVVQLVERLGELRGVAMKAGQILGYVDPSLSPELRALLSVLQTAAPASAWPDVERTLREAWGDRAGELLSRFERAPIAVASIGQVHRATLADGTEVAVKVKHAGIEAALTSDFKAATLGSGLATRTFGVAGGVVKTFVDEARTALLEECDYALEARRQALFAQLFDGDADLVVPAVVSEWCGAGVLTTAWCPGHRLEDWLATDPPAAARDRLGAALFRFYVGTLYRHGLFHADPHPGNYGLLEDGRVVVYDFGCLRQFERPTVRAFSALVRAVRDDDAAAMADAVYALGAERRPEMNGQLRTLLRGFFGPLLTPGRQRIKPDEGVEAKQVMQDKRAIMKLALPGKLLFLFRLRFGLYAVLSRIEAEADWAGLESKWAEEVLSGR